MKRQHPTTNIISIDLNASIPIPPPPPHSLPNPHFPPRPPPPFNPSPIMVQQQKQLKSELHESDTLAKGECPVCFTSFKSPIFLCSTGHSFCVTCSPKLKECPLCKGQMTKSRNYALEEIIFNSTNTTTITTTNTTTTTTTTPTAMPIDHMICPVPYCGRYLSIVSPFSHFQSHHKITSLIGTFPPTYNSNIVKLQLKLPPPLSSRLIKYEYWVPCSSINFVYPSGSFVESTSILSCQKYYLLIEKTAMVFVVSCQIEYGHLYCQIKHCSPMDRNSLPWLAVMETRSIGPYPLTYLTQHGDVLPSDYPDINAVQPKPDLSLSSFIIPYHVFRKIGNFKLEIYLRRELPPPPPPILPPLSNQELKEPPTNPPITTTTTTTTTTNNDPNTSSNI